MSRLGTTTMSMVIWFALLALLVASVTPHVVGSGNAAGVVVAGQSSPLVCTPLTPSTAPPASTTATPIPATPAAIGTEVPVADNWTVAVTDAFTTPTIEGETASGIYVVVNLSITNNGTARRRFPIRDLVLCDDRGRLFEATQQASVAA